MAFNNKGSTQPLIAAGSPGSQRGSQCWETLDRDRVPMIGSLARWQLRSRHRQYHDAAERQGAWAPQKAAEATASIFTARPDQPIEFRLDTERRAGTGTLPWALIP